MTGKTVELVINWPQAKIGGMEFKEHETRGLFILEKDGNYHSKDMLFYSARDTEKGTGRDLLSEYLASNEVKEAFLNAIKKAGLKANKEINVFLPEKPIHYKGKYLRNGDRWWYWLKPRGSKSSTLFEISLLYGVVSCNYASANGGVAPVFSVA